MITALPHPFLILHAKVQLMILLLMLLGDSLLPCREPTTCDLAKFFLLITVLVSSVGARPVLWLYDCLIRDLDLALTWLMRIFQAAYRWWLLKFVLIGGLHSFIRFKHLDSFIDIKFFDSPISCTFEAYLEFRSMLTSKRHLAWLDYRNIWPLLRNSWGHLSRWNVVVLRRCTLWVHRRRLTGRVLSLNVWDDILAWAEWLKFKCRRLLSLWRSLVTWRNIISFTCFSIIEFDS